MNIDLTGKKVLVTGGAGFIGSNLCEVLLEKKNTVVCLDNFATGKRENLTELLKNPNFTFIEGDIRNLEDCIKATTGVDYVLHQVALGSVPRSIKDPITSNDVNVGGFLNMLVACRDNGVKRFVYAASSSTYGDSKSMPKVEDVIGKPLSPYAVTKYVNELYAEVFASAYSFQSVGLRYFNVFGKRQDPFGAYAAVIPKWIYTLINNEDLFINGNGETSRDFCYVDNVVQANLLASFSPSEFKNNIYNVAVGDRTSLNQLFEILKSSLEQEGAFYSKTPEYRDFRAGDVMHSQASIKKISDNLGYFPEFNVHDGIKESIKWYIENL